MTDSRRDGGPPVTRLARAAASGRMGLRLLRRTSPALFHFLAAKRPQLRMAWGRNEVHLRRDGIAVIPRDPADRPPIETTAEPATTPRGPFIPRHAGEQDGDEQMFRTPVEGLEGADEGAPLEMDTDAMQAEVQRRMGMRPDKESDFELPENLRDPEALNAELARVRDVLQALDDVDDHALITQLDDELYQLYKAVDYKMRKHHRSEAKAELGKLFTV